jgi:hypothetical protein
MKSIIAVVVMVCVFGVGAGWTAEPVKAPAAPVKGPAEAAVLKAAETAVKGCEKELTTFCKDVTPGEGRGLACLYAYSDKLSGQCEYALYTASADLEKSITGMKYAANECKDDLKAFCADIKPGEGRLLQCIDKNAAKVSKRCTDALKASGLKK